MARPQRDMNASHRYAAGAETYSPSSLSTSTRQAPLLFNSPLTTRNSNIIKTELLNGMKSTTCGVFFDLWRANNLRGTLKI
jgi:hypothetical protein